MRDPKTRDAKAARGARRRPKRNRAFLRSAGRIALLLAALAGGYLAGLGLADTSGILVSGLVSALAVVGAVELVAAMRRAVSGAAAEDPLGAAALAASSDAMAVVEDGEKVVETNAAYLRLCRSGAAEPALPERFLARIPGSQALVGEMLNAVADGRRHAGAMAYGTGGTGRQFEVSVHPLGSARRVLWTLRMAGEPPAAEPASLSASRPASMPAPLVAAPPGASPAAPLSVPLAAPSVAAVAAPVAPLTQPAPQADLLAPGADLQAPQADLPAPGADLLARWDSAPAGLVHLDPGRASAPNLTLCRMLGYPLADWPPEGLDIRELVAPEDLARLRRALADRNTAESLALNLTRKDACVLPALVRIAPDREAGQGATAVVLALDSVLDLAPAAAPGRDADGDLFFLRAPLALALVDPAGRVRAANGAFARLFGRAAAGRPVADLVADGAGAQALLSAAREGMEPPAPCDVTVAGPGGRSARLYAATLGSAGGGEIALCAIDTTEQKALEVQFAQSQKLQAVGHLAGGVAHDFNNMLTAIIGYCDLLLARHRQSDPSFPDIMQIKQAANRAAGLVRQLLAFSRRQTLRPEVIELTDVISDVSELLRRLIGERITLEVHHARDLWPVKVDKNQFEQVIVNLVVNARDAMPDGGTLILRTTNVPAAACAAYGQGLAEADYVMVEVADTGTGIPPEIMDKIFEPFFSTKEVGKGTGLGLSTVYGIVEQTGGIILAESAPGNGTTFRVFLPRHEAGAETPPPPPPEPEAKVTDLTGQGRVLLVEDEASVRALASRALTNRGYEVLSAASGVEALEVFAREGKVDLVISDVVMPEMDGPTLLRELRARDPALKFIFISGYAEEAFARNLPPTEQFAYLSKPFSLKQLVAAVNEALRG
ncbi:response regulator [Xanthobacter sp. AM11]|uniref:response regulator n=1 Tax=Xanthobacter sp. AM11 TaxID=3380643 RepID=UPI0039BF12D9